MRLHTEAPMHFGFFLSIGTLKVTNQEAGTRVRLILSNGSTDYSKKPVRMLS